MFVRAVTALIFLVFPQVGFPDPSAYYTGAWTTPLVQQSVRGASAYLRERLVFAETTNTLSIEAFVDAEGKIPLFTHSSVGP